MEQNCKNRKGYRSKGHGLHCYHSYCNCLLSLFRHYTAQYHSWTKNVNSSSSDILISTGVFTLTAKHLHVFIITETESYISYTLKLG